MVSQVVSAVEYVHSKNIAHRDVKVRTSLEVNA